MSEQVPNKASLENLKVNDRETLQPITSQEGKIKYLLETQDRYNRLNHFTQELMKSHDYRVLSELIRKCNVGDMYSIKKGDAYNHS